MRAHRFLRSSATLICTLGIAFGAAAAERVYKWVDEQGVVHFGQQPPTTSKAEALQVQSGYSRAAEEEAEEPTEEQKAAAAAAEYCRIAKQNLAAVSSEAEVKRRDDYGEEHIMTAEEKQAEKTRAQAAIDRYCGAAKEQPVAP